MKKILFPILSNGQMFWPSGVKCPICGKPMANKKKKEVEQVVLNFGAMQKISGKKNWWSAFCSQKVGGFMSVHTHTHGNVGLPSAEMDVVEHAKFGQADLYFCSTKCLRAFFGAIVDELERRIKKARKNS